MFNRFITIMAVLVASLLLLAKHAHSETLSFNEELGVVAFEGEYSKGSAQRLDAMLTETGAKIVSFDSGGGVALEGFYVAQVLAKHKVTAGVTSKAVCMSACAISLLGAEDVFINGIVGFHSPYDPSGRMKMEDGLRMGFEMTLFFLEHGVTEEFQRIVLIMSEPDVFVIIRNYDEWTRIFDADRHYAPTEVIDMLWTGADVAAWDYLIENEEALQ